MKLELRGITKRFGSLVANDHIDLVVEPGEIESESATGRATLYVVLTRATQQMVTVSSS